MAAGNLPEPVPAADSPSSTRPLLILLIALCSIFVFTYALRLDERDRMEAAIAEQETANSEAAARSAALHEDLAHVASPSFVDKMARVYLVVGKEGETRLVTIDSPSSASMADAVSSASVHLLRPIWQQWLELLLPGVFAR